MTGPDGKDFTLYFDKESGLPVKEVAKVLGFQGEEYTPETTFADYKGLRRDQESDQGRGEARRRAVSDLEVTEFKVLDKVDAETFTEPK